jgi:hypothetical protein
MRCRYGTRDPDDRRATRKTYQRVRQFAKRFKARHKSILCRDLVDFGKSPVSVVARRKQSSTHCPVIVQTAVEILEEMVGDEL